MSILPYNRAAELGPERSADHVIRPWEHGNQLWHHNQTSDREAEVKHVERRGLREVKKARKLCFGKLHGIELERARPW